MNDDRKAKLDKILDGIQGLPTLPTILGRINDMMMDPNTTAKEMGQLISSDPAITSKILRVVNSSFYGFPSRITTVTHAIVILGFNTVKSIVLSVSVFGAFKGASGTSLFDMNKFWEHSISTGACTKIIASHCGYSAPEEFFISGLLHDVGKIVFRQHLEQEYETCCRIALDKKIPIRMAEEEVFGVGHAELGAHLMEKWKLAKGFVNSIRHHHNPGLGGDEQKIASVVHLGDIMARCLNLGSGGDPYIPAIADAAWESLALTEEKFPLLLKECHEEAKKARVYLNFLES
ncbi:MAG: HDOD domain-containing protein [Planctomycetota bacterium]